MWEWGSGEERFGIIGFVVGGPFAVLVAEQLFACGCELLISITSAGQIIDVGPPPYYVLIDRALRDEGTSYHYLPPSDYANADPTLIASARGAVADIPVRVQMESSALYAFATARGRAVICLAHVSNQLGCVEGDFEKGEGNGARWSAELVRSIAGVGRRVSRAAAAAP
jgi:uridine phosphorylase